MGIYSTTYFLGAGFSRSAIEHLPLSCDFFDKVRSGSVVSGLDLNANPLLKMLDEFVYEYFPQSPNLEEVMSFLAQDYFPSGFRQHWQHRNEFI